MGFLSQAVLRKKATAATTEKHPLFKDHDVPLDVKRAYLQGCVLAVLERDDGKVTDAARQEISLLGQSLELTEEDITEIISVVSGISSPEAQEEFLGELFAVLAGDVYPRYFMVDFEKLLRRGENDSEALKQTLDFFGSSLTDKTDWRTSLESDQKNSIIESNMPFVPAKVSGFDLLDEVLAIQVCHGGIMRTLGTLIPSKKFLAAEGSVEIDNANSSLNFKILEAVRVRQDLTASYMHNGVSRHVTIQSCYNKRVPAAMRREVEGCDRCTHFCVRNDVCCCDRNAFMNVDGEYAIDRGRCKMENVLCI